MAKCSDCKDGYYYPLMTAREPCQTCEGTQEVSSYALKVDSEALTSWPRSSRKKRTHSTRMAGSMAALVETERVTMTIPSA